MNIKIVIECEAGSNQKNVFDEAKLERRDSFSVSRTYPYPYGFIQNTKSGDGDCLDAFVLTSKILKVGDIIEVEVVGMFEQFETRNGIKKEDHNIITKLPNENIKLDEIIKDVLREFVLHVWDHRVGKKVEIGDFYSKEYAENFIKTHSTI